MDQNEVLINNIREIFIGMNKGTISEEHINMYCDKHKQILNEMDHAYRCMISLKIKDALISKTKNHVTNTMLLWRELRLPVTPSVHLFEDHIVYEMKNIVRGLADKSKDHIEIAHQDDKRNERIYCGLINFQQSQSSQLKNNDMMSNPYAKLTSEYINNESNRNLKRKR